MDPQSPRSPIHAEVYNPRPYALKNALGPQPAQVKLDPNAVVCPTDLGKTEAADSSSLLCHPGHSLFSICWLHPDRHVDHRAGRVDQPYLSDVAAGPALVPTRILYNDVYHAAYRTNQNPVYAPTHINYLGSRGEHSNCQIQHHPVTYHATSGVIVAGTGPAKAGNRTSEANPGSVSQKKVSNIGFVQICGLFLIPWVHVTSY
ncbi:hypothetical protein EDD17DRAFT_147083 [Pisolithus thermaeus]|nr:hypothetical protein EDD17DRAFT_147083 [Pisolithus thermaeus]